MKDNAHGVEINYRPIEKVTSPHLGLTFEEEFADICKNMEELKAANAFNLISPKNSFKLEKIASFPNNVSKLNGQNCIRVEDLLETRSSSPRGDAEELQTPIETFIREI